jgi:hypothetical protein
MSFTSRAADALAFALFVCMRANSISFTFLLSYGGTDALAFAI